MTSGEVKMSLVVYNTLTNRKEEFHPMNPPKVGMYVCGITAYDSCHLGHARGAIVFDMVARYLRHLKYDVMVVKNYTDVDDKIIKKANDEGVSCTEISEKYIAEYDSDMEALGVGKPDIAPKATEHIDCMINTIQKLVDNGLAYSTEGGVYFSVRKFDGYGKLSGKNIEDLESGARVAVDESKQDPLDFALWKRAKPGEPVWQSPWGEGRPGWHIECSAMSSKYLDQPFDIHGGGRDLIFPHHENEIAQAEGAEKKNFVKYWIHNGFININAEKMSKSLGNITSIKNVLAANDPEAVRLFLLANHYRSPIDYTQEAMQKSSASLDRFYETAERLHKIHPGKNVSEDPDDCDEAREIKASLEKFDDDFDRAMNDDFNTAMAVGHIFDIVRTINRYLDAAGDNKTGFTGWVVLQFVHVQHVAGDVLGIFGSDPEEYRARAAARASKSGGMDAAEIEKLIEERKEARKSKDFVRADEIRDIFARGNVEVKDLPDGTTIWRFK